MNYSMLVMLIMTSFGSFMPMEKNDHFDKKTNKVGRAHSAPPEKSSESPKGKRGRVFDKSLHQKIMDIKGDEAVKKLSIASFQEENDHHLSQQQVEELQLFKERDEVKIVINVQKFESACKLLLLGIKGLDIETVSAAISLCPQDKKKELLRCPLTVLETPLTALSWLVTCHGDNVSNEYRMILNFLREHGAKEVSGYTMLHVAAYFNAPKLAYYLLENKLVRPLARGRDEVRKSALHVALECGSDDVIKVLLNSQSYKNFVKTQPFLKVINQTDAEGRTPLHYAVSLDNKEIFEALCECGANLEAQDNDGHIPFYYLQPRGNVERAIEEQHQKK